MAELRLRGMAITFILFSYLSSVTVNMLPHENVEGDWVPVIFKGRPSAFQAFTISVIFTFTGAFTAVTLGEDSNIARFCMSYSAAAMASALWFMAHVLLPQELR